MEKRTFDPKNTILARFLGSNGYFFTYNVHFFFRGCKKSCKEAIERKKSGCHPRKNGHLTPKMEKIGLNNLWWANVLIREVKKKPRLVPNMLGEHVIKKLKWYSCKFQLYCHHTICQVYFTFAMTDVIQTDS